MSRIPPKNCRILMCVRMNSSTVRAAVDNPIAVTNKPLALPDGRA